VPLGAPTDILAQIAAIVHERGAKFILDSSGAGLSVTLQHVPVYMVKPSIGEFEALMGRRLDDESAREAAVDLVKRGRAEIVAVTMGASGAMVAYKGGVLRMRSPRVQAYSAVGAGDSFVGAMTLALSEGRPMEDALTFAISAGAASVLMPGTRLGMAADVKRIYEELSSGKLGSMLERLA
jgi:6-phosphofructokinase 2